MKIMDDKYLSNPFKITLAGLFKRQIRGKMVNALSDSSENIERKNGENSQHIILRAFLSEEYRRMNDGTDISDVDSTRISRFFTYYIAANKDESDAESQYYTVKENIIQIAKKVGFRFADFELLSTIKQHLKIMFSQFSEQEIKNYQDDVTILISNFDHHPVLSMYKESFKKIDFYDQLSCLVVIASTWACWDKIDIRDARDLAYILLPSTKTVDAPSSNENEWKEAYIAKEREKANGLLIQCRAAFSQKNYPDCGDLTRQIIELNFADDLALGEAYYYLSICCSKYKYDKNLDSKALMLKSAKLGYPEAYKLLVDSDNNPAASILLSPLANAGTHGMARIVINAANEYTEEFLLSIPSEMRKDNILKEMIISASGKKQLQASVDPSKDTRYLLFDESQEKNFQDLLYVLERIASSERKTEASAISSSMRWSKTTIYIRVSEDKYSSLIDTALKRLGNFTVRVFIIDDDKRAAQSLLADYPLYDAIKGLSRDTLIKGPVTINFTVICNENTPLTSWLIREAYWISCFSYPGLKVKINLLSPFAAEIQKDLRFNYPSMFLDLPDSNHTSSISVLKEAFSISSVSDYRVIQHFDAIEATKNSFNYYVVNIGDDISNLNYGIKLREWSIRNRIDAGKRPQSKNLPTIAFYCKNSDIAYLSQNMVVQMVDHGNRWHNNYNLKPFGMLRDRYSWTSIDGGYWEKVAESTHLQYCGVMPNASSEDKISGLKDYFARSYNRDSSMAVALSLPYRLFQVKHDAGEHITPYSPIDNTNTSGENEDIINSMAEQFRTVINDSSKQEQIINELLYYEHSRWIRWAYSRGWNKAEPEQVITYMNAGNPKQQLYIAKLHGCLCSISDLKILSKKMVEELEPNENGDIAHKKDWNRFAAKRTPIPIKVVEDDRVYSDDYIYTPKDFTDIDKSNIIATADIIQTQWIDPMGIIVVPEPIK